MQRLRCEILVVGAGPAGIAAAVRAAELGRDVVLLDDNPAVGGQIWRAARAGRMPAKKRAWLERLQRAKLRQLSSTSVIAAEGPRCLLADSPQGPLRIDCQALLLATGARELYLPFPGWTLPGVVGIGALQALLKGGWTVAGKRVAFVGSGPLMLAVAAAVREAGGQVAFMAEQAPLTKLARLGAKLWRHPRKLAQLAALRRLAGKSPSCGWRPQRVLRRGAGLRLDLLDSLGRGRERSLQVDYVATGFGLVAQTRLAGLLGCELRSGPLEQGGSQAIQVDVQQATSLAGVWAAGEATGIGGVDLALVEGEIAGLAAAGQGAPSSALVRRRVREQAFAAALERAFALEPALRTMPQADTMICRCEDVRFAELSRCTSLRDAKLQTRCGMGVCQGRICGPALGVLEGWQADRVRPPLFPVRLDSLQAFNPVDLPGRAAQGCDD